MTPEEAVRRLETSNEDLRAAAAKILGAPAARSFAPGVAALLDHPNFDVIAEAVSVLGAMQATEHADRIAELTAHPELTVRLVVMKVLAAWRDLRCVDAAVALLAAASPNDAGYSYHAEAAAATDVLRQFGRPQDGGRIADLMHTEEDDAADWRAAAIHALGIIGARDERHRVAEFASPQDALRERTRAVEALGVMGADEYAPLLAGILRDQELARQAARSDTRAVFLVPAAIAAAGRMKARSCAGELRRLMEMEDGGFLRALAAKALLETGAASREETVKFLGSLVKPFEPYGISTPWQTLEALDVLNQLEAREAVGDILRALGEWDPATSNRYWLERVLMGGLEELGFKQNIPRIVEFLSPPATETQRRGALRALSQFRAAESEPQILALLAPHEPLTVRVVAVNALAQCGDRDAASSCLGILHQKENPLALRMAALKTVGFLLRSSAFEDLIKLLERDEPAALRAAALEQLSWKWPDIESYAWSGIGFQAVIDCLHPDEDHAVKLAAVQLLRKLEWRSGALALANLYAADESPAVRYTAYETLMAHLENIGEEARVILVQKALRDLQELDRGDFEAFDILEKLARGNEFAGLLPLLDPAVEIPFRLEALKTLEKWQDATAVRAVAPLLAQSEGNTIRLQAMETLRAVRLPESAQALSVLLNLQEEAEIILSVLNGMRENPHREQARAVAGMLQRQERSVQLAALDTLIAMKVREVIPEITALLSVEDKPLRIAALKTLQELKAFPEEGFARTYLHAADAEIRAAAVLALGQSGGSGALDELRRACYDPEQEVRVAAVKGLGALGTPDAMPLLMQCLLNDNDEARRAAADEISFRQPVEPGELWSVFLEAGCRYPAFRTDALIAGLAAVRNAEKAAALRFLRSGAGWQGQLQKESTQAIISGLLAMVQDAQRFHYDAAQKECADAIADAVALTSWTAGDLTYLDGLAEEIGGFASHLKAGAIRSVAEGIRDRDPVRRALRIAGWVLLIQPLLWVLVLLVYPWSALAQGMVWSRWVRRIAGFGWVGPVVVRVPWLRERVWRPFREALVPPGEVVSFDEWTFFDAVRVKQEGVESQPALRVLEARRGVTVLRGESGLGKTTLLQALAGRASRPVALLRAVECSGGLLEALRARLPRRARGDAVYLRALVVRGSPDILVDAVHESLPEVRAKLSEEIASLPGANILLTTQPAEWTPPAGAAVWTLEPLRVQDIAPFLLKQGTAAVEAAGAGSLAERQRAFAARAAAFLDELEKLPPESARAVSLRRMLGNPMEAVLAAELLAAGQTPDPDRLLEQRMEHLTEDYTAEHGGEFPASAFAEHLRSWRSSGAPLLRLDVFAGVASFLARHRLLRKMAGGAEAWRFRHDKIMEWFLRAAPRPSGAV